MIAAWLWDFGFSVGFGRPVRFFLWVGYQTCSDDDLQGSRRFPLGIERGR